MRNLFHSAAAVAAKEFRHLARDRAALTLMIGLPVFQLMLFGYALNLWVANVPAAVLNLDGTAESRSAIRSFETSGFFRVARYVASDAELEHALIAGDVKAGIRVPRGYSADVLYDRPTNILLLIDGSEAPLAAEMLMAADSVGVRRSIERIPLQSAALSTRVRAQILFNPSSRSANFLIPGLIGILVQMITSLLAAVSIVREKERGTIDQMLLTQVGVRGIIAGKLAAYGVIGFAEACTLLALMRFVFRVPVHGSVPLLIGCFALFLVPSLAIGLLISARAMRQSHALQLTYLVFLPSVMLSGFLFPRESMPPLMYHVSQCIPVTYFIRILRAVIVRGAGIAEIRGDLAVLAGIGIALLLLSMWTFETRNGLPR
jgi:ABC-2 type transport system permease protein